MRKTVLISGKKQQQDWGQSISPGAVLFCFFRWAFWPQFPHPQIGAIILCELIWNSTDETRCVTPASDYPVTWIHLLIPFFGLSIYVPLWIWNVCFVVTFPLAEKMVFICSRPPSKIYTLFGDLYGWKLPTDPLSSFQWRQGGIFPFKRLSGLG